MEEKLPIPADVKANAKAYAATLFRNPFEFLSYSSKQRWMAIVEGYYQGWRDMTGKFTESQVRTAMDEAADLGAMMSFKEADADRIVESFNPKNKDNV